MVFHKGYAIARLVETEGGPMQTNGSVAPTLVAVEESLAAVEKRPARTNYVLVDLENVVPDALDSLTAEHFRVLVFVGACQEKLPFHIVAAMQRLGPRAAYVKCSGIGPNALDFHIAYYIGQLASSDPTGYFHIVSKDTGFDPLIQHLRSTSIAARRVPAIAEIPPVKAANARSLADRQAFVLSRLGHTPSRPRTVQALSRTIAAHFNKQLSDDEVAAIVRDLMSNGYIAVEGASLTYALPGDD